ncbi:hypothetical protein C0J52_11576 [Blattella germanica]|nr:hypothetical protein C0J52_11576 [Blattella germanica]
MLVQVYSVKAGNKKYVLEWFKYFRDGKEGVEDEPRSDRPSTSVTPDNIERVLQMIFAVSPDLAPADLVLFLRLKRLTLRFVDVSDIKQCVIMILRMIPQKEFSDSFKQL